MPYSRATFWSCCSMSCCMRYVLESARSKAGMSVTYMLCVYIHHNVALNTLALHQSSRMLIVGRSMIYLVVSIWHATKLSGQLTSDFPTRHFLKISECVANIARCAWKWITPWSTGSQTWITVSDHFGLSKRLVHWLIRSRQKAMNRDLQVHFGLDRYVSHFYLLSKTLFENRGNAIGNYR
jgi:hypothetical protein